MALTQVSKDVLNSSQANITQVGTLANLTVTNTIVGSVSGDANNASFLGGTPAASYALGSAVTTANTAMKGYVDGQVSTLTSNAAAQSGQIAATNTAITTANTNMKGYVDAINSTLTANAAAQSGQIASKADLSGATFTGNITTSANVKFTGWHIYETGTNLYFAYNGAVKMSLNTAGNLTVSGDVAGFGTP